MKGWSVRVFEAVGKTEVLCSSVEAIRALKGVASEIPSSDVYPSFDKRFGHTLFFFDVRPEFTDWLMTYLSTQPIETSSADRVRPPSKGRRFSLIEMSVAAMVLVLVTGLFAWGLPSLTENSSLSAEELAFVIDRSTEDADSEQLDESAGGDGEYDDELSDSDELGADSILIIVSIDSSIEEARKARQAARQKAKERRERSRIRGELRIWFVDVKQGDGIIMKTPGGKWVVIDANKHAAKEMIPLLKKLGCKEIHAMLMSHPHSDHIGDLHKIMAEFPVKNFYDPGFPHTTATYKKLLLAVEKSGSDYHLPKAGEKLDWDKSLTVTALNASREQRNGANNGSLVVKVQFGSTSALFTGDAEKEAEHEMVERFKSVLGADLLKVGHHGSKTSTSPEFLAAVRPRDAVISCGTPNSYGHPTPSTLSRLAAAGIKIHRTDKLGTILAVSDGRSFTIKKGD